MKGMRCKKSQAPISTTSKIKRYQLVYEPCEGTYKFTFEGQNLILKIDRGEAKLTTECRTIEYLKELTIYGNSLEIIRKFMDYVYSLSNPE